MPDALVFTPEKRLLHGDDGLAKKIRRLRDHGAAMTDQRRPYSDAGYNQRMTDLQF